MLRKHIIISEDLYRAVRDFRFQHHFDTELAAFRVLIATGLRAYREEKNRDVPGGIAGAIPGGEGASEPAKTGNQSGGPVSCSTGRSENTRQ